MPKIFYQGTRFRDASMDIIKTANKIIAEYAAKGFDLTLRQLYYQFVARGFLGNTQANYKKLGSIINDARLAGLIDWERIEDRTRGIEQLSVWDSPSQIITAVSKQFKIDLWDGQEERVEVWIEKEALAGVFERICNELRVPYLSCRGYVSQSEMWRASERLKRWTNAGYGNVIFHFGDHDPSGVDMSRDIEDRLNMFGAEFRFERLALTMEQVHEYDPPPNPTKDTDSRSANYTEEASWELDALNPTVLADLVRENVEALIDPKLWNEKVEEEKEHRRLLTEVANQWDELTGDL